MNIRTLSALPLMALALLSAGCAPGRTATDAPDPTTSNTPTAAVQGDPTEGEAALASALQAAGLEVAPGESVEQPFFAGPGRVLKVNGQDVQVFEYASPEAMEAEAAQVSADGSSIGTSMVSWMAPPHFYKSGRLLVLYVGEDAAVLDALESALGEQFAGR